MLGWRLFASAFLIPALIALFVVDHRAGDKAWILLSLCLLLAIRSVWELVRLLGSRLIQPSFPMTALLSSTVIAAGWSGKVFLAAEASLGPILMAYTLSILVLFLNRALQFREPGGHIETLAAELLVVSYVGVLLAVTAQLRWVAGAQAGYLVIGSVVIAAKMGDVGAYTLGRLFGRRKMSPYLSPGKTCMGGVGALLGAGLGAVAWLQLATPWFNSAWKPCAWYWALVFGVVIGAVGLVGDLCESLIKREAHQKDSAKLLPGFGGLLDLLDSVLFAGPVGYFLWKVLPLATWM